MHQLKNNRANISSWYDLKQLSMSPQHQQQQDE